MTGGEVRVTRTVCPGYSGLAYAAVTAEVSPCLTDLSDDRGEVGVTRTVCPGYSGLDYAAVTAEVSPCMAVLSDDSGMGLE